MSAKQAAKARPGGLCAGLPWEGSPGIEIVVLTTSQPPQPRRGALAYGGNRLTAGRMVGRVEASRHEIKARIEVLGQHCAK